MDQQAEKGKTERETGLGRRTREGIAKWNQMTALRFQMGGDIRHLQPPLGGPIQGNIVIQTSCSQEQRFRSIEICFLVCFVVSVL